MADVLYFALRIRQMNDGVVSWNLSSAQEDLNAAKALVCDRVTSDRKNNAVVSATNLCIGSDGSIPLKNYFTHDLTLEVPAYAAIEITQYTEESAKPLYKAVTDFNNEYDAETEYWTRRGNDYKDDTIDTALNIVLNWHGGVEASDYWVQYPEPEPEPPIPPVEEG